MTPLKRHKQLFYQRPQSSGGLALPARAKTPSFPQLLPPAPPPPLVRPWVLPKKTPTLFKEYTLAQDITYPPLPPSPPTGEMPFTLEHVEQNTRRQLRRQSAFMEVV